MTPEVLAKVWAALLAVKAWRAGPEGLEIMFSEGAKMIVLVDEALRLLPTRPARP